MLIGIAECSPRPSPDPKLFATGPQKPALSITVERGEPLAATALASRDLASRDNVLNTGASPGQACRTAPTR